MINTYLIPGGTDYFWLKEVNLNDKGEYTEVFVVAHTKSGQVLYRSHSFLKGYALSIVEFYKCISEEVAYSFGNKGVSQEILYGLNHLSDSGQTVYVYPGHNVFGNKDSPTVNKPIGEDSRINDLPGVLESVKHPVTGEISKIKFIIINLNDKHGWTRHQVADWLETLDVDIEFKSKEEMEAKRKERESKDYYFPVGKTKGNVSDHNPASGYISGNYPNKSTELHKHYSIWNEPYYNEPKLSYKEAKYLIEQNVVPTTDKWYTLGYADKLDVDYTDVPKYEPYKYVKPKDQTISFKLDGDYSNYLKLIYGEQNDKD